MTKKHFEAVAARIRQTAQDPAMLAGAMIAARIFADMAAQDNPRFDRARFMAACGF